MKKIFYLMLVVIFTASCATGYYAPHNVNQFGAQTQVVLDKPNFRIVRHIDVVVDINNTNLKRADVEKSAYAELLRRANLTGSQALINVVIEEVRRESVNIFRLLFSGIPKVTQHVAARATVIEFVDESGNPVASLPAANQGTAPRVDEVTEGLLMEELQEKINNAPSIQIDKNWMNFTRKLAKKVNNGESIDPIYDLNEDGVISVEELNKINSIYVISVPYSDYKSLLENRLKAAHKRE